MFSGSSVKDAMTSGGEILDLKTLHAHAYIKKKYKTGTKKNTAL